jgi:gliding motility-associated protein GldC
MSINTKKSSINFHIELDEKNIPENINWEASDNNKNGLQNAKAMMIALWDTQQRNGLTIDLWTKEMTIEEMNIFYFQTFMSMSDSFLRATQNKNASENIKSFAKQFFDAVQKEK